ncbi:MAG: CAP domain-containing protein [Bauldia sp.]
MRRLLVLLFAAAAALAGCAGGLPGDVMVSPAETPVEVSPSAAARMVTAIRAENGFGPVTADPGLNAIAEDYANALAAAGVVNHTVGGSFPERIRGRGYTDAAENLGGGYRSLDEAMAFWVASPGHFANLLTPGATRIGIATAFDGASPYRNFWVLILAAPAD